MDSKARSADCNIPVRSHAHEILNNVVHLLCATDKLEPWGKTARPEVRSCDTDEGYRKQFEPLWYLLEATDGISVQD